MQSSAMPIVEYIETCVCCAAARLSTRWSFAMVTYRLVISSWLACFAPALEDLAVLSIKTNEDLLCRNGLMYYHPSVHVTVKSPINGVLSPRKKKYFYIS